MILREAQFTDASALAKVHVDSWRTSYAGIVPADFLAKLSYQQREATWREILAVPDSARFTVVAEDTQGEIVGFASGGPERDGHPLYRGELYAIYLLAAHQRRGVGRRLMAAITERLLQRGLEPMLVWVLADNWSARTFYEALGGQLLNQEKELTVGGVPLMEVAYGWLDIRSLTAVHQNWIK